MRALSFAAAAAVCIAAPLCAQLEETHLPFVAAERAFETAAQTGRRVLVYQDWPG